jgi:type III secretion system low calcium response chaperone LcrH/SycD
MEVKDMIEGVSKEKKLTKGQEIKLEKMLKQILEEGILPKDALGLSDQTIEAIYAHAYRLYQSAKYKDAGYIFSLLQNLNPQDWRFYLGMGACLHRLGKYETASFMYQVAGDIDVENPLPYYYCSDCRIKLGHFRKAAHLLKNVVMRSVGKKEYSSLRDRALMTIRSLEQQLQEEDKQVTTKTG